MAIAWRLKFKLDGKALNKGESFFLNDNREILTTLHLPFGKRTIN
jgi:hypothetical protein